MAKGQEEQKHEAQNVNTFSKGLHTDNSYLNQPPDTYTFALNAVNVTKDGDEGWRANEESNEECYELTLDGENRSYVPLGKVYIGNGEQVILSTSLDEVFSEIGVVDKNCIYTPIVTEAELGFKLTKQISVTFRLRRGCERTIYFSTPTPMIFNLDAPDDFKTGGNWDINKFKLFKTYQIIPEVEGINILENGALFPGSYNASVQYLDSDLNPTEWIMTTEPIKIYNISLSKEYKDIRGSITAPDSAVDFGVTNKAIRLTFKDFDTSYPFYRVAMIGANSGNGQVSTVHYSSPISTEVKSYTYSGVASAVTIGTEDEIIAFNNIIEEVEFIEQVENRLTLSKTKGVQVDFCNLQKYASRVTAQMQYKTIILNSIGESNPKTPTINFDGTGYMPGEIYSFGIVYIFEDRSLTPEYHIPGKALTYVSNMSDDNKLDTVYPPQSSCNDYWGVDSEGNALQGTNVRHHRFPSRREEGVPLFTKINNSETFLVNYLSLDISGIMSGATTDVQLRLEYTVDAIDYEYTVTILKSTYNPDNGTILNIVSSRGVISVGNLFETVDSGVEQDLGSASSPITSTFSGLTYTSVIEQIATNVGQDNYEADIMTLTFSNIVPPSMEDTNNHKIVGYYIVRNERTEDNKTILDNGIIAPTMDVGNGFTAHGQMYPNLTVGSTVLKKDIFALIHPEHKFNNREYRNTTEMYIEGEYGIANQIKSSVVTQDVGTGTSYNPAIHKSSSEDYDGYSLHTLTRDTEVNYLIKDKYFYGDTDLGEITYLNTLNTYSTTDADGVAQQVYNISGDNKVGIVQFENNKLPADTIQNKLFYVSMKRSLANPYENFQVLPYFKDSKNPTYFTEDDYNGITTSSENVQNGDSYITPMRYVSSVFYNLKLASRDTKSGTWKIIAGALLIAAGIAGAIFTGGTSLSLAILGASMAVAGLGVSSIASGIETNKVSRVYEEIYNAGLKDTIVDNDTLAVFGTDTVAANAPEDDEFQWLGDVVTNLWFESGVNMALRHGVTIALTDFLDAPNTLAASPKIAFPNYNIEPQNILDTYMLDKLTTIDTENQDGRLYRGYAGAETYFLNPDYIRTNKQKVFYALGLEYDCCSDCNEDFPHRSWYSEQSFQEELTDNFRAFLPNNYRDIEGEKGVITDVFRLKNNLYIQTEEALWHLPQNIQERVTGDVVSFIGTGSFFSIPPRLIDDSDFPTAGTTHNWARIKTSNGVLFVSESDRKIYMFNGEQAVPITLLGNSMWFKNNMEIKADADFYKTSGLLYPMANNPSNEFGTGYISAYDTEKERLIITKKDFILNPDILALEDYNVCSYDGEFIVFEDYHQTIDDRASNGWVFNGMEYCKMKFSKIIDDVTTIEYVEGVVEPDPIAYDNSWTMSYSLKDRAWIGWHSYMPNFYLSRNEAFHSWKNGNNIIWKHNKENHYQTFYDNYFPHILEYVDNKHLVATKITDFITLITEAQLFVDEYEMHVDKEITFNKLIGYNTKQSTGELELITKIEDENYLFQQVKNNLNSIIMGRHERDWSFNDLRDRVTNYNVPIFRKDKASLAPNYFIDKVVNEDALTDDKSWNELQSLRDKYLVLRFIFDNFDNIRLITNYTRENENISHS